MLLNLNISFLGCPVETFSCDDWDNRYNRDNCVPLLQRCDGIKQCSNGKDELDCNILLESFTDSSDVRARYLYFY